MKDLLGREIKIGDIVALAKASHADLITGVVTGFTKQKVSVSQFFEYNVFDESKETICTYDPNSGGNLRFPDQIIILNTKEVTIMTTKEYYDKFNEY